MFLAIINLQILSKDDLHSFIVDKGGVKNISELTKEVYYCL